MRILFLSAWFPYPPINGAKLRIYNLIRQLAKNHEITLLAFAQTIPLDKAQGYIPELEKYCRSVNVVPAHFFNPQDLRSYKAFFSLVPRSVVQTYNTEMADLIEDTLRSDTYDVIVASEVYAPALVSLLASGIQGVPKILDALEVALAKDAYESQTRLYSKLRNGLTWLKLRRFTKDVLRKSDACTVPSKEEKENLQVLARKKYPVEIIPHSLDLDQYQAYYEAPVPNTLVFTGSFSYYPNIDAVQYFTSEIFPIIRKHEPAAHLKIIGNLHGMEPRQFPGHESMTFTGLLTDVRPDVANSWVSIVPLRMGAGTRLKIVEAMALGTPVVSTTKGAEGLEATHGENILIADTPAEFSQAVLDVLCAPRLRQKLSAGGRALIADKYDSEVMGAKFSALIERVVKSSHPLR